MAGPYGSLSNTAVGSPVQFNLTATGSPAIGDFFDFGLIAASNDAGQQKKAIRRGIFVHLQQRPFQDHD